MKRIMGIDYGKSRIGVALSDPTHRVAFPFCVIDAKKKDVFDQIQKIVREEDVSDIYVGNPLLLSGKEGALSREVQEFVEGLKDRLGSEVSIHLVDERLTTKIAERLVRESGHRPTFEKEKVDMVAAAVILQGVLEQEEIKREGNEDSDKE